MFNTWSLRETRRERRDRENREGVRRQVVIDRRKLKEEKWGKTTSDDEPFRRNCTTMPLITLSLVCGRHSDQRSCIDNPKRRVWSNSVNEILSKLI